MKWLMKQFEAFGMSIYYGHILIKIFSKEIRAVRHYAAQNEIS